MALVKVSAAAMILHRLQALGVEFIFINSGTDYPPLVEAYAQAISERQKVPELVVCPHENAAIGMAHGYYLATGKVQAVMVHTNVGLANAACGVINLACNNIPVLIFGGRTPISEHSHFGCRNTPIGYGQEMRDQAALVRESVKWDFELRLADQVGEHIDRAWAIASSLPRGPVYLSLPREPLCETFDVEDSFLHAGPSQQPVSYAPTPDSLAAAASLIAGARCPVIFSQRGARGRTAFELISALVEEWSIPVVEYWGTEVTLSAGHPMYAGNEPDYWLSKADLVIVVDSQAPWMIDDINISPACKVIQLGPDPLFSRYPVRGYQADVNLAGDTDTIFRLLAEALKPAGALKQSRVEERYAQVVKHHEEARYQRDCMINAASRGPIGKPWLSHCLGIVANKYHGKIVSELTTLLEFTGLTRADSYYQEALSGGLGEAFPIALGLQLADRDGLIIAAVGDGSYLFSNPAVCHHIAQILRLPVLVVVGNNSGWGAVAGGTLALYPEGYAANMAQIPATSFTSSPDMSAIAASGGAAALAVNRAEALLATLEEAVNIIHTRHCSVLVDVALEK
ncbi:thiamine pyrophosphate-requiring protein [Dryocola clanedunensis]|uniref:thiamine pyrophosphate-requiring protein n=1 Tax=Cedecea sulfonylureivorans TaxID=3051154 RepID=UPI0019290FCA|nr:thiamine pyrophosphate-requiring protein [Cedecea sulfonylureivorans]